MSFSVSSLQTGLLSGLHFLRKHPLAAASIAVLGAGAAFRAPLQEIVKNALSWNGLLYCGGALVSLSFAYTLYWYCKTSYFEMHELQAQLQQLNAEKNQLEMEIEVDHSETALYQRFARRSEIN